MSIPPIVFFVAKGADDSCGRGCNSWIAAEGRIDDDAASRFRKFMKPLKDRHLPIYFSSPGGNLEQALAMGNMLRQKPIIARIGHATVRECGAESQTSENCLKIKKSGRELEADLTERQTMCNSACPFIVMGATTREIGPEVTLGIHSPRVILRYPGNVGRVPAWMREEATDRSLNRFDKLISSHLAKMGIDHALLELERTVKFEDKHFLTREELVRFHIDTRQFVETPWLFEINGRSMLRKFVVVKKADSAAFRKLELRLYCENNNRARMMLIREFDPGTEGKSTAIMMAGSDRFAAFGAYPAHVRNFEAWSAAVTADAMKQAFAAPHLQVAASTPGPDGKAHEEIFDIDTFGLEPGWAQLSASCTALPNIAKVANPFPAAIPQAGPFPAPFPQATANPVHAVTTVPISTSSTSAAAPASQQNASPQNPSPK